MPHQHLLPSWLKPFYISASVLFCWISDVPCRDVGPSPPAVPRPRRRWQSSCLLETEWLLWRRWQVMTYVEGYVVARVGIGWILVLRLDPGRLALTPKVCPNYYWGEKQNWMYRATFKGSSHASSLLPLSLLCLHQPHRPWNGQPRQ